VVRGVRLPGAPDRKKAELQQLAEQAAVEAAAVAGMPGPTPKQEPAALLQAIRSALAVIAEALANRDREVARLRAQPAAVSMPAPRAPTRAALTLAELRDRLRVLAAPSGDVANGEDPGRLGWVIERLDEARRRGIPGRRTRGSGSPSGH
jgi:hypothetical protein